MVDAEAPLGDLILLPTGYDPEGDQAVITRSTDSGTCLHREVTIDETARRMTCRRCDAEVDVFVYLRQLAGNWQWYRSREAIAAQRAKDAEAAAEQRVKTAQRSTPRIPMPVGQRLRRISRTIGRAQSELGEAFGALAEIHDTAKPGLADFYLRSAVEHIERARSSLQKLVRDYGNQP